MDWCQTVVGGNELWRWIQFAITVAALSLVGGVLRSRFRRLAEPRPGVNDQSFLAVFWGSLARPAPLVLFAVGLQQGLRLLSIHERLRPTVDAAVGVLMVAAFGFLLYSLVDVVGHLVHRRKAAAGSPLNTMLAMLVSKTLRMVIVVLALVQAAEVLSGKPMTSLIAGLGVGGLAVALAAQETIKNFFGSLVILGDKPFDIGQRVVVDGHDGEVEYVGLRSTRIRTLNGHQVIIPNGELANRTILNIGRREFIKREVALSLTYDTPVEKIDRAKEIVRELLRAPEVNPPAYPPRVHFADLGASALIVKVVYWYSPPDYWAFCAFSDGFNRTVLQRFREEGIEFAFPTQTVHLAGKRGSSSPGAGS